MKDFEKLKKYIFGDMMVLAAYFLISAAFLMALYSFGDRGITSEMGVVPGIIFNVIIAIVCIFNATLAKKGDKAAGIIAIVIAALLIISFDWVSLALGIFLAVHSVNYLTKLPK